MRGFDTLSPLPFEEGPRPDTEHSVLDDLQRHRIQIRILRSPVLG
jgi:hypothetical protein